MLKAWMRRGVAVVAMLPVWAAAQNLIVNPGNESPLVGGEIPGWTELVGSDWGQRSDSPLPFEGQYYFFAGVGATATLRQVVDLAGLSASIDAGLAAFAFEARLRSFAQTPADSAGVTLTFVSATNQVLGSYSSGPVINTAEWQRVATVQLAPVGTRRAWVDLEAIRHNGSNNDGYFDALSLQAVAVPEPGAAALSLLGLAALVGPLRRRRPLPAGRQVARA